METPQRQLVNVLQAARLAGVSRRTVYNWMEEELIEWTQTPGGGRRIYVDSLFKRRVKGQPCEKLEGTSGCEKPTGESSPPTAAFGETDGR